MGTSGTVQVVATTLRILGAPDELDPELDAGMDLPMESQWVDPEVVVQESPDRRDGPLADADDADLRGADHHHLDVR